MKTEPSSGEKAARLFGVNRMKKMDLTLVAVSLGHGITDLYQNSLFIILPYLSKDLGLALHHRIEARGNPENVPHRLFPGKDVKVFLEVFKGNAVILGEKIHQIGTGFFRFQGRRTDLDPVAGGEDHILFERTEGSELAEGLLDLALLKGQPLPHLKGCRLVI